MEQQQNNQLPKEPVEGEIVPKDMFPQASEKGVFINTLNVITSPAQSFLKPLKRHYHHHYHKKFPRHHKKIFFFDLALIASIVVLGVIAVYYFLLKPTFHPLDFFISSTDQKIIIGSEHSWELRVNNTGKKTLHAIATTLTFPASFKIIAPENENSFSPDTRASTTTRVWKINTLSGKEKTSIDVRGIIFSPVGETLKIIARTEGLTDNQELFSETNILEVRATHPALVTTVDVPKSILAGESFPINVNYANASSATLVHPVVRFEVPSSFALSNKPSSWQDGSIILPTLMPGDHGSIELTGSLTADSRANRVSIGIHTSAEADGRRIAQEDLLPNFSVTPTGIKVSLKNIEKNGTPGEQLHLIVSLDHTGSETFQRVSVCVPFDDQNIDTRIIQGDGHLADNAYCFTSDSKPELQEIKNGFHSEWPITFSLKPVFHSQENGINKNAVLAFTPHVTFMAPHTPPVALSLNGPELRVPITTTLTLQAMGRYFTNEGDQLGRGPLPPQTGKTTKYWIAWAIRSSLNPIKNLTVRAIMPPSVQWTGKSTVTKGKSIMYNPATREISWTHELLESNTDTCACAEGGFEISFTPSEEDVGTTPILIKGFSADGTDAWTEIPLHAVTPDISSELFDDPLAKDKGRVQR